MTYFLLILAVLLIAGGLIFSVLPPLPGPLLSLGGLLCAHFSTVEAEFSTGGMIFWVVVTILVLVADYLLPVAATKQFGGTKAGVWGGIIGTVLGVILPIPFGIIVGPLLGAIVGDLVGGNHIRAAVKSGFGSFVGFLVATGLKVLVSVSIGVAVVIKIGTYGFELLTQ
ncbi:MAG: DUF456 domain-containing protein [Bacteroidota bacterium]